MQPSEFWALPVADWWVELDAHIAEAKRLDAKLDEAKGKKSGGSVFTAEQWEDARRRHREKMSDRTSSP